MTKDKTKGRVGLYFNLEDEDEKLMFDHLEKRKKSQYIKNLIMNDIKGNRVIYTQPISENKIEVDKLDDVDLDSNEIDFD